MMSRFYRLAIKSQTPPHVLLWYHPNHTHPLDHRNRVFNLEASLLVFLGLAVISDALTPTATSPFARGKRFPWAK